MVQIILIIIIKLYSFDPQLSPLLFPLPRDDSPFI